MHFDLVTFALWSFVNSRSLVNFFYDLHVLLIDILSVIVVLVHFNTKKFS
jgi:quinol-cytochrome oxidoreductase complex cytochrome b subunit